MLLRLHKIIFIFLFLFISFNLSASVTHVWPSSGVNEGEVTVHIFGDGFNSGVTNVNLYRSGNPIIAASNIQVVNDNYLTGEFNLQGVTANTYNLIVNTDTLAMCFTVNSYVYNTNNWSESNFSGGADYMWGVTVGDGNNDGELEVYGANIDDYIYQCHWDGNIWNISSCGSGNDDMWKVAVGDGNNDGKLEVYGANNDHHLYQYRWNGSNWLKRDLGAGVSVMYDVTVGDGNNDGGIEVYGANADDHLYQFNWNGSSWVKTDLGMGGDNMRGVAVGDGNNDGEMEVYGANQDGHIYQFSWNGSSWDKTDLGSGSSAMMGVAVGDGNNDGDLEVYGANLDKHLYQYSWDGNSWSMTDLGSGGGGMYGVAVGDGNNDGEQEVYGSNNNGYTYQFSWDGSSWYKTAPGSNPWGIRSMVVGDGNNDGELEVYGTGSYYILQNKVTPEPKLILSDSSYVFSYVDFNDTLTWQYLGIENIGDTLLIILNLVSSNLSFSVINYSVPDTIVINDTSLVEVIFSPTHEGLIAGSLAVYSNDPWDAVKYVYLEGLGDFTAPTVTNLIFPLNNSYNNQNNIDFIWGESTDTLSGVDYYDIQIAYDPGFSQIISDTNITDTTVNISLPDSVFYWRVKSVDQVGNESPWSTIWIFLIDTNQPSSPSLSYPINGVFIGDTLVNFSWSEVDFAEYPNGILTGESWNSSNSGIGEAATPVRYVIELDTATTFTIPYFTDTLDTNGMKLSLSEYGYYYWHVKAYDLAGNESPFSGTDSFGVDMTSPVIESTTVWTDTSFNGPFTVNVKITDNFKLDSCYLFFKRLEDPQFWSLPLELNTGDWFTAEIPMVYVNPDTIKYYIYAQDAASPANTTYDPSGAPAVYYYFVVDQLGVAQILEIPALFSFSYSYRSSREVIFNLALPGESFVSLKIFDLSGREVSSLISGNLSPAFYTIPFKSVSSGTYFYQLESSYQSRNGKFIIVE